MTAVWWRKVAGPDPQTFRSQPTSNGCQEPPWFTFQSCAPTPCQRTNDAGSSRAVRWLTQHLDSPGGERVHSKPMPCGTYQLQTGADALVGSLSKLCAMVRFRHPGPYPPQARVRRPPHPTLLSVTVPLRPTAPPGSGPIFLFALRPAGVIYIGPSAPP